MKTHKPARATHHQAWAALAMLLLLGACGGASSPPPAEPSGTAGPASGGSDASRTSLEAYSARREAAVPVVLAAGEALSAGLALALPPLQDTLNAPSGTVLLARPAIVFPALQAARIDVLRAAARGDTRAELEAALPAAAHAEATRAMALGVSRTLWAAPAARFERGFLRATDPGPLITGAWQATTVPDWTLAVFLEMAAFGDVVALAPRPETRLVIGHRAAVQAAAGGQFTVFDGVGVASPDRWYTAPMLALEGPGGVVGGADHRAIATWTADHLWVLVRPLGDEPLFSGLPPEALGRAVRAAWSAYPSPAGLSTRSRQVWPQLTGEWDDRSRLPAGVALPYDERRADLSGLDGGGTVLTESARPASLQIDASGLRALGTQAMAFTFHEQNLHGGSSGGVAVGRVEVTPSVMPACPRAVADWRGAYLALIDRSGQLLLLASLPGAPGTAATCRPG